MTDLVRVPLAKYRATEVERERGELIYELLASGRFGAIDHLLDGLTQRSAKLADVEELLGHFGASARVEAVEFLTAFLAHRTWQIRKAAAEALAELGEPRAVDELLRRAARERQATVRGGLLEAAAVCGRSSSECAGKILAHVERGSTAIRVDAIVALRHYPDDARVADHLRSVLDKGRTAQLRAAAAWSLAFFDDPEVDGALAAAAERGRRGKYAEVFDAAMRYRSSVTAEASREVQASLQALRAR